MAARGVYYCYQTAYGTLALPIPASFYSLECYVGIYGVKPAHPRAIGALIYVRGLLRSAAQATICRSTAL